MHNWGTWSRKAPFRSLVCSGRIAKLTTRALGEYSAHGQLANRAFSLTMVRMTLTGGVQRNSVMMEKW